MQALAEQANRFAPILKLFDANGHRRDVVEFHPAYHELMAYLAAARRRGGAMGGAGAGRARRARGVTTSYAQIEDGTLCPTTMTYASVPALRARRDARGANGCRASTRASTIRASCRRAQKRGVTLGMGMTEKQGGSDVRANTTRAEPAGGRAYRIVGHKWFFSAPMCDAFLILAQAPGGLSCFLLPRFTPDGTSTPFASSA